MLFRFASDSSIVVLCINLAVLIVGGICIAIWILYVFRKLPKRLETLLEYVGFTTAFILSSIFYVPALGFSILGASCEYVDKRLVFSMDHSVECMKDSHLGIFLLSVSSMLVLCTITMTYKIYIFNPSLNFDDPTACLDSTPSVIFHVVRSLLLLVEIHCSLLVSAEITSASLAIILILFFWYRFDALELYHKRLNDRCIVISALAAWIAVLHFLALLLDEDINGPFVGGVYMCGIGIIILTITFLDETTQKTIAKSSSDLGKILSCLATVRLCQECDTDSRLTNMNLAMHYSYHYSKCQEPYCPITIATNSGRINPLKNKKEMIAKLLNNVSRQMKKCIGLDHPHSLLAKMFYLSFILHWTGNCIFGWEIYKKLKSMHNLSSVAKTTLHFHMLSLKKAEKAYEENKSSMLEIEALEILGKIKLEKRLRKTLERAAVGYSSFWDILQDQDPQYNRFLAIGISVVKYNNLIRDLWKKLCSLRGCVSRHIVLAYSLYCREILFDKKSTIELGEQMTSDLENEIRMMQFDGIAEGVVAVSALAKSLGKVIMTNNSICVMTGYSRREFADMKFSLLIPPIFRSAHDNGFETDCYKMEESGKFDKKIKDTFLLAKSGYIFPVDVVIVDGPNLLNSYCFVCKLRQKRASSDFNTIHILTDPNGIIQNLSSSIFSF